MNSLGKQDLLNALKVARDKHPDLRIPCSYRSLIRLEKKGIVPYPENYLNFGSGRKWRLYSREEINSIVKKVIAYKQNKKK